MLLIATSPIARLPLPALPGLWAPDVVRVAVPVVGFSVIGEEPAG